MKTSLLLCAVALGALPFRVCAAETPAEVEPLTLVGWGLDHRTAETFVAEAAATGFDVLITWSTDPASLQQAVAAGETHGVRIFSCIAPLDKSADLWRKRFTNQPVPWQVLTPGEEAALSFTMAGTNQYMIPYQFGGEPKLANEVLGSRVLCFTAAPCHELFRAEIDAILSVPGVAGVAFDGFGYQNFRCCHCARCQGLLEEYRRQNPDLPAAEAEVAFFRQTLVDTINTLAAYARSVRPSILTSIHIWPAFAPDPLYGNRLDIDFCGQTAAWYTCWPQEKIAAYSRVIAGEAKRYHARQQGVGMIGYYDLPGRFPVKDAARVRMELETMIANGCRRIQVCGTRDVIRNAEVAAVFRALFK